MPVPPRELFSGLVDDAALFPPGNAPMGRALREHAEHRGAWYADVVGPFLCPATRVEELRAALPADRRLSVSLVVDVTGDGAHAALRSVAADDRLELVAVEAAHARLGDDAAVVGENLRRLPDATGFLEVPRAGFDDGLDLVAKGGWRAAKYRTGGVTADAVPTDAELAAFLVACAARALPFKLTAGLHHATRHEDETTGALQHGLLNVLAAVARAVDGSSEPDVASALAAAADTALVAEVSGWDEAQVTAVRTAFRSFGCCGVTDPIRELAVLGLVREERR
jgi:hypothetical protein